MSPAVPVLDALREVVFQVDARHRWLYLNQAWETLSGEPVDATLGRHSLQLVHPDDRARTWGRLRPLMKGEEACCSLALRYLRAGKEPRWAEVFLHAIVDAQGRIAGVAGTLHDFSGRKAACPDA